MRLIKTISLIMIYLVVAISFALYIPKEVSATTQQACCERTQSGAYCRYTDVNDCDTSFRVASNVYCDNIDFCKPGCCYDTVEGSCQSGVAKSGCETAQNSIWNPNSACEIEQCQLGCCQISNQCSLATPTKCRATTSLYPDVEMLFHSDITTEQECIDKCRGTDEGACISTEGSCQRTTRADCTETKSPGSKAGFYPNMLCSHPDLGTNCAQQQRTNCVGEDVYWFDSCGNKENIYNSNKRVSYNSGYIQKEEQSCRASPNDKDCGNCDYFSGSLCGEAKDVKPAFGNFICRDMNCYDVYKNKASPNSGGNKKHGESWCLYDALPGPGKDVVGSRHRRAVCMNGEEIIEECRDFREEFCIQNKIGAKKIGGNVLTLFSKKFEGYTEALCKENKFDNCITCPDLECCNSKNKDCVWKNYGNTGTYANGACVPIVPPGLKHWDSSSASWCAKASQVCVVKYHREALGGGSSYECIENCHCEEHEWIVAANNYCKALGDCGAYYNIEGKATLGGHSLSVDAIAQSHHFLSISDLRNWNTLLSPKNEDFYEFGSATWHKYVAGAAGLTALISALGLTYAATHTGTVLFSAMNPIHVKVWATLFWIAVIYIAIKLLHPGKDRTYTYTFTCEPWEAPSGGKDCEKCNKRDAECTEYICKSLGKACELINEGTEDQKCIATKKSDSASPVITAGKMEHSIIEKENGFEIQGKVKPFTPVELILETNEAAQCKFSLEPLKDYEEMEANFGTSIYLYEHKLLIPIPSEATTEEALLATNGGRYQLYIKCKDSNGNVNPKDYSIKFQIDPGPDQTPPSIEKTLPDNNSPIPYDAQEYDITLLLNEPADCKWSLSDKDLTQMKNNFVCAQTGLDISPYYPGLYECKTTLKDIKQNQQNTYYFRCKDKSNNIRQESYVYSLISTPPLQIMSTKPEGKLYTKYPVLEVTTLQGADNGVAICGFNEQEVSLLNMLQMYNTNSTEHSQQLQPSTSGKYTYYVTCLDKAGNTISDKITFSLEISPEEAQIYNIYKDAFLLHISTVENTLCEYSDKSFIFGTGTSMTGDAKEHTADLGLSVYHIRCQDKFNNQISTIIYP